MRVSEISFGAWAIGGSWGPVKDEESYAALNRAVDLGVNFIDTADVYSRKLRRRERAETTDYRRDSGFHDQIFISLRTEVREFLEFPLANCGLRTGT